MLGDLWERRRRSEFEPSSYRRRIRYSSPIPSPSGFLRFFMRIISFNANGLRSAANKGFFDWCRSQDADVLCVQETKAQEH